MAMAGAEMDVNVFLIFNACIPALKSLTLDRCQIATTSSAVNKAYPVKPLQKWLRTVVIAGLPASKRLTLLQLQLLSKEADLYFLLLPFRSIPRGPRLSSL